MFNIVTTSITCRTPKGLEQASELMFEFSSVTRFRRNEICELELREAPALGLWAELGDLLSAPWTRTVVDAYQEYSLRIVHLRDDRVRIEELYSKSSFELPKVELVCAYEKWTVQLMADLVKQWPSLKVNASFLRLQRLRSDEAGGPRR